MTRLERKAALAVLGATAAVAVSGIRLAKKRAAYLASLAASKFHDDGQDDSEESAEEGELGEAAPESLAEGK